MLDNLIKKIKIDWWEVTNLGFVGYIRYFADMVKYLLRKRKTKPKIFSYSECQMDLNFDFSKDTEDPKFN